MTESSRHAARPFLPRAISLLVFLLVAAIGLAAPALWRLWQRHDVAMQLEHLAAGTVESDLDAALQTSDERFIAIEKRDTILVPGIEDFHERFGDRYDLRIIPAVGSYQQADDVEREIRRKAHAYIIDYNRKLLIHLRAKEMQGKRPT